MQLFRLFYFADDHTRVKIKYNSTDDNNVGYINANYIEVSYTNYLMLKALFNLALL